LRSYGISESSWDAYCGICGGKDEAVNNLKTRVLPENLDPVSRLLHVTLKTLTDFIVDNKPKEYRDLPFLTEIVKELRKAEQPNEQKANNNISMAKIDSVLAKRRIAILEEDEEDEEKGNIQ
jgi:hypothetical protein